MIVAWDDLLRFQLETGGSRGLFILWAAFAGFEFSQRVVSCRWRGQGRFGCGWCETWGSW